MAAFICFRIVLQSYRFILTLPQPPNADIMNGKSIRPINENILWNRLRAGDREAFGELYTLFLPQLLQYAAHFTKDRNLVKDVLQDFFVTLFHNHAKLGEVKNVKSYLLVAMRRDLFRRLNKEKRQPVQEEEQDYHFYLELSPEHALINKQYDERRSKYLQQTINGLSPRQKEAIYLYFFENAGYELVAEIMSLKEVKYARTLIYRALAQLKLALSHQSPLLHMAMGEQ